MLPPRKPKGCPPQNTLSAIREWTKSWAKAEADYYMGETNVDCDPRIDNDGTTRVLYDTLATRNKIETIDSPKM